MSDDESGVNRIQVKKKGTKYIEKKVYLEFLLLVTSTCVVAWNRLLFFLLPFR